MGHWSLQMGWISVIGDRNVTDEHVNSLRRSFIGYSANSTENLWLNERLLLLLFVQVPRLMPASLW